MNRLSAEDLDAILHGTEFVEALPEAPIKETFHSEWVFRECDEVYHRPLGRRLYEQPHQEICGIIEGVLGDCSFASGGQKLIMIGVPRGSNKTTIAAENTPPIILTKNPNARILIDSFRFDVSKKRLRAAKWHFEKNPEFHARYGGVEEWMPQFRERPWSDEAMTVMKRTLPLIEPSIEAAGTDRSATGAHYDVIISDDLVNDVNSRTKEQRDKVFEHIQDQMLILEPNGVYILIFTTWHTDDAYARWMKIDDRRIAEGKPPFWRRIIRSCYDGPEGLYYPERFNHEILDNLRDKMGSRKFSAQMLLSPIADEDKTFSMDVAREVNFTFEPRQFGGIVRVPRWANEALPVLNTLFWDPKGPKKGGRASDFHGITVVGTDPMDRFWVHEAEQVKDTAIAVLDRIIKLVVFYQIHTVGIEDVSQQTLWLSLLQREFQTRGIIEPAYAEISTGNVPKNERIELELQPRWERGHLIYKPTQTDLRAQIDGFTPTNDEHEDILDSLAGHSSIRRVPAPDFINLRDENPVDPEWLRRRERMRTDMLGDPVRALQNPSAGGVHGPRWAIGR